VDLLIPERFRASHREQVAAFARGPTRTRKMGAAGREIFGLRKNGEEFPVEASISKAEVGGRLLLNVSLRDVTDTRRTEDEQRFLADLGEALIGAAPDYDAILDGIARAAIRSFADLCLVDLAGTGGERRRLKIAHADPAKAPTAKAIERLGIERGRSPYLRSIIENGRPVLAGEVPPGLLASVAQDEENLRRMEALGIRSFIAVPVLGQRGTVGVIAFVSSRPFRRYGARDLRLAERVATLAALAVENARLHDLALRAVRARDEVLGIVAHDLRNPLQSISLQAEYLEGEACDPLAVQGIRQSAKRMSRLVQDMLDVAHLEAGPLAIRRAPTPARSIAADAVEAQLSVAAASSLDLRLELPDDLPDVLADRDRLLQILDNLIGNALKFTPAGGRVTVGATADGEEVRFRVTDTGPGIPPDDLPHVFDRFWQAKRSDRRGAGLGLAIALGLVEAHGGRITVESVPGHGATFTFTVPVAR
jgi:signal transduction histidine kinase